MSDDSGDKAELLQAQLIELQTQVAFQEETISELNEALGLQQLDIAALKRQWEVMRDRYRELQAQLPDSQGDADEPPPPHY